MRQRLRSTNYIKEVPQLFRRRDIHYRLPYFPLLKINPQQALCMFASHLLLNISSFAAGHLTNRALYKMYAITGSCRRRPRMSRPLMSSVTEPPLHSWEGDRETPVTRPSLTTVDNDSWGELAPPHTSKRKQRSVTWQHDGINTHVGGPL